MSNLNTTEKAIEALEQQLFLEKIEAAVKYDPESLLKFRPTIPDITTVYLGEEIQEQINQALNDLWLSLLKERYSYNLKQTAIIRKLKAVEQEYRQDYADTKVHTSLAFAEGITQAIDIVKQ